MKTYQTDGAFADNYKFLIGSILPRPIAVISTRNIDGSNNLAPFSFFTAVSASPMISAFCPMIRTSTGEFKDTVKNILREKEFVLNFCTEDNFEKVNLASTELPFGEDEFKFSGLTPIESKLVKARRLKESPVQFECKVNDIISLGNQGGAGNLVICEVVKIHVSEAVLDANGAIDQYKIDLVSRMGGNWYSRANQGLFEVPKPLTTLGIGVDEIPDFVKESPVFDGNDLGMLGNVEALPTQEEIDIFVKENFAVKGVLSADDVLKQHQKAKEYLNNNEVLSAWKVLLAKGV